MILSIISPNIPYPMFIKLKNEMIRCIISSNSLYPNPNPKCILTLTLTLTLNLTLTLALGAHLVRTWCAPVASPGASTGAGTGALQGSSRSNSYRYQAPSYAHFTRTYNLPHFTNIPIGRLLVRGWIVSFKESS